MFRKDQPFKKYNIYLDGIVKDFFRICSQKETKKTFTITDMTALNLDVAKLTAYTQLLVGSSFTIRLYSGEKARLKVKAQRFQLFPSIDPSTLLLMEPDLSLDAIARKGMRGRVGTIIYDQETEQALKDEQMVGLDEFDRSVVEFITTFKKINKKPSSMNYFT